MNYVERVSERAKRIKEKFISCAGFLILIAALIVGAPSVGTSEAPFLRNNLPFKNDSGLHATFSAAGRINLKNEFFQDLGANGRRCVTCHTAEEGWTITPAGVQERFERTAGTDPIFRTNDGAKSQTPMFRLPRRAAWPTACCSRRD